jgi:hypothetical protein
MDKGGTGSAVIRFLPAPEGCELPWAQVWSHAFQGPGGWLIDNCLTTNKDQCPVCEANRELWNTGSKDNQNIVRDRKRKLSYYSNIYVIKDPAAPQNEGKIFLYKFGKKVFDKIMAAMQPEFDDEKPINPFDFWEGANFKLKLRKVEGYWNYDKCEFSGPETLLDSDDELETIYKSLHNLNDFTGVNNFKSYADLKKRLDQVLGTKSTTKRQDPETMDEEEEVQTTKNESTFTSSSKTTVEEEENDDALSYFQKLAES